MPCFKRSRIVRSNSPGESVTKNDHVLGSGNHVYAQNVLDYEDIFASVLKKSLLKNIID